MVSVQYMQLSAFTKTIYQEAKIIIIYYSDYV